MHYLDYNEKKQHGSDALSLEYYYVDEQNPRYQMPFHWHNEIELIRILEGQMHLYLDDREYHAHAGDLFYISGGIIHGSRPFCCKYECLVFDLNILPMHTPAIRAFLKKPERGQITVLEHFDTSHHVLWKRCENLFSFARGEACGWELKTLGALLEFYGMIFEKEYYIENTERILPVRKINQLKPVLEYIEAHYSEPVTLKDLAHIAGMSPKYFCRVFRLAIHRTPVDYLNYYRIERACFLMEHEDFSCTEIAYRCGFNDSSYFVRIFKKYKQITPKQYEKRLSLL